MAYSTINPADLHSNTMFNFEAFESTCSPAGDSVLGDLATVDSAVDLNQTWPPEVKHEPNEHLEQFLNMGASPAGTNTPSPPSDMIFSNFNSPGDFVRDPSQTSSPETTNDLARQDVEAPTPDEAWNSLYQSSDAILIPQSTESPIVCITPDKTKTRAETQIKMSLIIDPLEADHIQFPRKTLAKPKHFASEEEKAEIESKHLLRMDVLLICALVVEKPEDRDRAMRRAAGKECVPRRAPGVTLAEMERDDPAHPQNGGEVLICEGCKERERKRYDRKKKRTEDEEEFSKYESERVIMINEKEYKKLKDVDSSEQQQFSARAKQVDFAMRIACYCRHQEEKSPMGYRVIFTFTDLRGSLVAQHLSEVFHITDDHKNKEISPEAMPRPLTIPQGSYVPSYQHPNNIVVPMYQYGMEGQYPAPLGPYSHPSTPVMSNFQGPMSPMDGQFNGVKMEGGFNQPAPAPVAPQPTRYSPSAGTSATQFASHRRGQSYYDAPLLSPTAHMPLESQQLPRPQSMDNFNFQFSPDNQFAQSQNQYFASAPQSAVTTPINLSRPASPTWEQGPNRAGKKLKCVYFYVDE